MSGQTMPERTPPAKEMSPEQERRLYKILGSNSPTDQIPPVRVRQIGQHIYHHTVSDGPKLNVKIERNSKGYNWEVTVTGATSTDQALQLIAETEAKLKTQYGPQMETTGSL